MRESRQHAIAGLQCSDMCLGKCMAIAARHVNAENIQLQASQSSQSSQSPQRALHCYISPPPSPRSHTLSLDAREVVSSSRGARQARLAARKQLRRQDLLHLLLVPLTTMQVPPLQIEP